MKKLIILITALAFWGCEKDPTGSRNGEDASDTGTCDDVSATTYIADEINNEDEQLEEEGFEIERELLVEHETLSTFEGINYSLCMGLTSMCPVSCGASGERAKFKVVEYTRYEKHSDLYGDPMRESKSIQVSDYYKEQIGDPEILNVINCLEDGDLIRLWWRHDYVHKYFPNGTSSHFPDRPILRIEKVDN